MVSLRRLEALASACYDASLGRGSWDQALRDIAVAFNGTHATLLQQDLKGSHALVLASNGFEADTVRAYEKHFKDRNVLLNSANQHLMRPGVVRTNEMMCPDDVFLRSEYYNDFLRPVAVRHLLGTTARLVGRDGVHLSVFRPAAPGAATPAECRALGLLAPHVERALQVHERLHEAQGYAIALEDYLSRIARGAALVTATGVAVFMNSALRVMLQARDGLIPAASGFAPQAKAPATVFARAVANAAAGGPGGRFAVPRPSGAAPYFVLVSRLGAATAGALTSRRPILVIVSDPSSSADFDRALLQETYGLTPAECLVACQLANGHSIESLAEQMHVSVGTVKTHLKRSFSKTSTHRQADLVRLLLLGRAWP